MWQEVTELHRQRETLAAESFAQRRAALEATWDELLAESVTLAGDRYFLGRMRNTGSHHFGCLYHDVETTNNRAERRAPTRSVGRRPAVIARKVSCGNRTQRGASTWQILVSLATTAQQCGRDFLEELTTAIPLIQLVPAG